ncbi:MAG: hypothetical protein ACREC6_00605 [Hyphomicrobiaceae bacterium]
MVEENKQACTGTSAKDWAGDWRTLAGLWGLPGAAMLAAAWLEPPLRAVVWSAMLIWMGSACLANARRCGRTHCRFTGPFFLVMAAVVAGYAAGGLQFGPYDWAIVAAIAAIGNALIWWGSERLLGTFRRQT